MSTTTKPNTGWKSPAVLIGLVLALGPLSACSTVEKGWRSTKDTVSGLFSSSDDEQAGTASADAPAAQTAPSAPSAPPSSGGGGLFMGNSEVASKFKSSATDAPASPTPAVNAKPAEAKPKKAVEGLVADRNKSEYADQGGRQAPVTVRPLNEGATSEAGNGGPPRPQAAPTERVTRLAEVPATPPAAAAGAAPTAAVDATRTKALAERLSAAPPSAPNAPTAPVAAAPVAAAIAPPASAVPMPKQKQVQPLIPSNDQIASYDSETVVIDGNGVRAGRASIRAQQSAAAPRASFDPGNASVSSEVGTVSFAFGSSVLTAKAKAMLADVAKLRAQVDGAIRIVGRGDQASARAASISRELRRLGVPAARLYDGGADNTLLGDEADLYVDY